MDRHAQGGAVKVDVDRERSVLALYETVADLADDAREAGLATAPPAVAESVRALLARDARTTMLRTISSEDPDAPESLPDRIGPYRIVDVLGRGGMGTVLLGERDDALFEHRVAIKLLRAGLVSPAARERFAVERGILARLHHPHIAQLLDGGVDPEGRSYFVMELLDGAPITDHADSHGLSLDDRLTLFLQACGAAEHAHRNLIVHSDIKPSNVLVTADFGVKLLDFGIARVLDTDEAAIGHTPGYASAAQRAGLPPTPADDVHALGKLLEALLAGMTLDADLAAVVAAASAPVPGYGAVSELIADIANWCRHRPVAVRRPEPLRRALLYWRRHRAGVTIVATTILLLAAAATVATVLYLRAARAQAAAEARFEQTRSLSRFLLDDVATSLAPLPGSAGIRRAIAERANRTFAELAEVPGASDALRIDAAEADTAIGAILASAGIDEGADPRAAERTLGRATDGLAALHRAEPGRTDVALALARALIERARSLSRNQADHARAEALLDRADAVLAPLSRSPAPRIAIALWESALMHAEIRDDRNAFRANLDALGRLLPWAEGLPVAHDADRALRVERGRTFLANAHWYLGDKPAALVAYRAALAAVAGPQLDTDARVLQRRAYAAFNIASALDDMGTPAQALAAIRPAVEAVVRLRLFDGSIGARNMENIVRLQYAYDLSRVGRADEAVAQARRSVAGRRALAALQPGGYNSVRSVPTGMRTLAEMLEAAGRTREACAVFAQTDARWRAIARDRAITPFDRDVERGEVRKGLARCAATGR